jgi:hypothetical protein
MSRLQNYQAGTGLATISTAGPTPGAAKVRRRRPSYLGMPLWDAVTEGRGLKQTASFSSAWSVASLDGVRPLTALSRPLVETFDAIVDDGRHTSAKGVPWPTTLLAPDPPRRMVLKLRAPQTIPLGVSDDMGSSYGDPTNW